MTAPAGISIALGALLGLAWSSALRAYMVELAGRESSFDWLGTFGMVLAPGLVIGAGLGWADYLRRTGGRRHWRWLAAVPLLFAIPVVLPPGALSGLLATGIGGGAVAVPLIGMIGGYAISGRGPLWGRLLAGLVTLAALVGSIASIPAVNRELVLTEPHGAWVAVLVVVLLLVLAVASSIPHRRPVVAVSRAGATA
jgi:hypothetical protein